MDLIVGLTDAGRFISHYTTIETAIEHILPKRRLRIGTFSRTNDPKENKTWEFQPGATRRATNLVKYNLHATQELSRGLTAQLKGRARVVCFCSDQGPLTATPLDDIYQRGFAKARMWAQYGGAHTGVCLVFDRLELERRIEQQFTAPKFAAIGAPIQYVNRRIIRDFGPNDPYAIQVELLEAMGMRKYAQAHLERFHHRLFFRKSDRLARRGRIPLGSLEQHDGRSSSGLWSRTARCNLR